MKILICGSRNFTDTGPIAEVIDKLPTETKVIVGDATGADNIAQYLAHQRGDLIVEIFFADWDKFGKSAGPKRNIEMLEQKPDRVYAFPIGDSVGTWHTIREAEKRNIPVSIYEKIKCIFCNGTGIKVNRINGKFECNMCLGTGFREFTYEEIDE